METSRSIDTPMSLSCKLDKNKRDKKVDTKLYKGMISSLLYFTISRLDIMFSICICARYQSDSRESYLLVVKKNFKLLSGILNVGLWYDRLSPFELIGYFDVDFTGCKLDRKSTSGICQFFKVNLISWFSKK